MTGKQDQAAGQIRSRLERAQAGNQLIRVTRAMPGADALDGYVRGVGLKWALLAIIEDGRINGYAAFRLRDVARVNRRRHADRFVERSLELDGAWPPPPPPVDVVLDSTQDLVQALVVDSVVVSIHIEYDEPAVAFVGVLTGPRKRRFTMTEITTQGEWDEDLSRWDFDEVSRIDFGDEYLRRLALVAGPRPEPE